MSHLNCRGYNFLLRFRSCHNEEKTAVVIDLKQWGSLWEKFYHTLAKTAYPDEQWLQQFISKKKLIFV